MNISEEEIRRLDYERFYHPCAKVRRKLHAIYLKRAHDYSNVEIGKILNIHHGTVARYIKQCAEGGLEVLYKKNYHHEEGELEKYKDIIIEDLNKRPVRSIEHAALRIKELTGIEKKRTQTRAFLVKHGFKYRKLAPIPGKLNTEAQEQFLEDQLKPAIEKAEKGEIELLFCDAAHFTLSAFLCMVWAQARTFLRTSHGRNRINVLGAVNAISKEVTTLINTTSVTATTIMEFLALLSEKYARPIFLVLDNAKYQHCEAVKERAKELGVTLLFLPPYSPNLNIIERLWKFTKKEILHGMYYDSPDKFHSAVKRFFETVNKVHKSHLTTLLSLEFQLFDKDDLPQNQAA